MRSRNHEIMKMCVYVNNIKSYRPVQTLPKTKLFRGIFVEFKHVRYIVLVREQPSLEEQSPLAQTRELPTFNFMRFQENLNLSEPVAAN